MKNVRPYEPGESIPGTVQGKKIVTALLLACIVRFAAAETARPGGEEIAFGASFSLHMQRGANTFQLALGPSASVSWRVLPELELWEKAYTAAFTGHSSGVVTGVSFSPRFGSWIPSVGAGLGASCGNSVFFTKKLGSSTLPDPFTVYGSAYLSPLRFTAGSVGFSVLDVGVGTDFREFGKSLIIDSSLLSIYFFPWAPAAGESASVNEPIDKIPTTETVPPSDGKTAEPRRWEIGVATGLALGIFSMLKVPNSFPLTISFLVRGFGLFEASFVSTFSNFPPAIGFSPYLSAELLAAPEFGAYRPALGLGYGFMPMAFSPVIGIDPEVLHAFFITMVPARFELTRTDNSSFFVSALELRYGPFIPMGGYPSRAGAGNFVLLIDFVKAGYTVSF